jgi:hypothetical protein
MNALAQLDGGEVRQIAIERDLVVRAAVRVVENGASARGGALPGEGLRSS